MSIANSGLITAPRLAGELLGLWAGTKVNAVPYRGGAEAAADITTGRVHTSISQMIEALPLPRNGVRAIAVTSSTRSPRLPDVPAIAEQLPPFDVTSWNGIFAPTGTPAPLLDGLNEAVNEVNADRGLRRTIADQDVEFTGGSRVTLAERLDTEMNGWNVLRREMGLSVD